MNLREWDASALVIGAAFVVIGLLFLLESFDLFDLRAAVVLPILLIALGGVVLLGALARRRPS
jgi:hypothetical protein